MESKTTKKEVYLIRPYYVIFEDGDKKGIVRMCDTMNGATHRVYRLQSLTKRSFFIRKMMSWDFKGENLLYIINEVGTTALKRSINDVNGYNVFNI